VRWREIEQRQGLGMKRGGEQMVLGTGMRVKSVTVSVVTLNAGLGIFCPFGCASIDRIRMRDLPFFVFRP
jgi:hypothetical protein